MSKKTISVNPQYLKPASGGKSRKGRQKKSANVPTKKIGHLRGQVLSKIKAHKKKAEASKNTALKADLETENVSELDKSLAYLQSLSKKKAARTKKHDSDRGNQPPYSCLKGGSRPTYRAWKKQHSTNSAPRINLGENYTPPAKTARAENLDHFKSTVSFTSPTPVHVTPVPAAPVPAAPVSATPVSATPVSATPVSATPVSATPVSATPVPVAPVSAAPVSAAPVSATPVPVAPVSATPVPLHKRHGGSKKTRHKLGKYGKKVSILIKNRQTRKKVKDGHRQLKQTSITEVKNYLKDRQLLKSGSTAPNDVLREIYEKSILAGDVSNKTSGALMHNFLAKN